MKVFKRLLEIFKITSPLSLNTDSLMILLVRFKNKKGGKTFAIMKTS
ncbi:hypothetical protein HMPREF0623_0544 [Pediococcus acidilactici DSM 20284]|uniref:Uncharacterized protein n=1 Tax=Pediococcus acidilactici DSM 20284 TaxID=862514 RepID=E0NE22_PEDAC|nr:hypothetical protein HMPREF0623_0544 [Pediococcus acidilactici DSM 20284]